MSWCIRWNAVASVSPVLAVAAACLAACDLPTPDVSCPGCSVELEFVATIGGTGDSGSFPAWPRLSRDSRGRFYGITPDRAGLPFLFDSSGKFVQEFGREGDGPGEYRRPRLVLIDSHDSLYILDGVGRMSVLSPSHRTVRTALMSGPRIWAYDAAFLSSSRTVFDYQSDSNPPLHTFDLEGNHLASFGDPQFNCRGCGRPVYMLGLARDSTLWTAQRFYQYRIDRWDGAGARLDSAIVASDWFAPYDSIEPSTPERRPQATVSGVWEDERGLLWILGRTADAQWAEGFGDERKGEGGIPYYPIEDLALAFDGVVEVVDSRDWSIVASRRLDEHPWLHVVEPGLIASLRESTDGWWLADVYAVQLTGFDRQEPND